MIRVCLVLATTLLVCIPISAQTAGAKAPEVTSFEPVDAANLVDKRTGDFQYSLPLLAIPGAPGGAYPLNLSYHAGISYRQEASWVGLGWNLTPGQVSRTVRGYPDDYNDDEVWNVSEQLSHSTFTLSTESGWRNGVNEKYFSSTAEVWGQHQELVRSYKGSLYVPVGYFGRVYAGEWATFTYSDVSPFSAAHGGMGIEIPTSSKGFTSMSAPMEIVFPSMRAYGYIHTPNVRDLYNQTNLSIYTGDSITDPLDVFTQGLQPTYDFSFSRDFQQIYHYLRSSDSDFTTADSRELSFLSDSVSANVDAYQVSAHGVGGQIRPVLDQRGWMIPADSVRSLQWEGDDPSPAGGSTLWMHPYRTILDTLGGLTGQADDMEDWQNLFSNQDQGWNQAATPDNMIFIGESGHIQDHDSLADAGFSGTDTGDNFFAEAENVLNTAKKVHYETDNNGRITTIVVTRKDGLRYIFGLHGIQTETNNGTDYITGHRYGAAPRVTETNRHSETRDSMTGTGENKTHVRQLASYAYAWYLAAVESPDYVDEGPAGYSPEDKGEYIYFRYAEVAPAYQWQSPWSDNQNDPKYQFTGKVGYRYQFERETGRKELAYPSLAVTRTHVAVFDYATDRTDNQTYRFSTSLDTMDFLLTAEQLRIKEMMAAGSTPSKYVFAGNERNLGADEVPVVVPLDYIRANAGSTFSSVAVILKVRPAAFIPTQIQQPEYTYLGDDPDEDNPALTLIQAYPETGQALCVITNVSGVDVGNDPWKRVESMTIPIWDQKPARLDSIRLYHRDYYQSMVDAGTDTYGTPTALATDTGYITKTVLGYETGSDRLQTGMPNADSGASLTLGQVSFEAMGGVSTGNPYSFDYHEAPSATASSREHYHKDPWGYYSPVSTDDSSRVDTTTTLDSDGTPIQAAWSLSEITTPIGTVLDIDYERDRYTWVQDRVALSPGFRSLNTPISSWTHATLQAKWTNGDSDQELMDALTAIDLGTFDSGDWDQHIAAIVDYKLGVVDPCGERFERMFVLNLDSSQNLRADGGLEHFVRWLRQIDQTLNGAGCEVIEIQYHKIPANHPLIREGGGLRVAAIHVSELSGSGLANGESFTHRYFYNDPDTWETTGGIPNIETGRESGVIFSEPPTVGLSGSGSLNSGPPTGPDCTVSPLEVQNHPRDDYRIIRAEEHAYTYMANPEVFYQYVTTRTERSVGGNDNSGSEVSALELLTNITARDPMIIDPLGPDCASSASTDPYDPEQDTYGVARLYRDDTYGGTPLSLASIAFPLIDSTGSTDDQTDPIPVTLNRQTRSRIINNTGLLGQASSVEFLDEANPSKSLSKTEYTYTASLDPTCSDSYGTEPFMARFGLSGSTVTEVDLPPGITATHEQGVFTESAMAFTLAYDVDNDDNVTAVRGRTLLREEVFNHFRPSKIVRSETFYESGYTTRTFSVADETVAWDYYTGDLMFSKKSLSERTSAGQTAQRHDYTLTVPAHVLFDEGVSEDFDMVDQNMLAQPGYTLRGRNTAVIDPSTGILSSTGMASATSTILGARLHFWLQPADNTAYGTTIEPPSSKAWALATAYDYVHQDEDKDSTRWSTLPIDGTPQVLDNIVEIPTNNGRWEIMDAKNTLFNERLAVIEQETRRGVKSAIVMTEIRGSRLPAAVFTHAGRDQVTYQGFEGPDPDLTSGSGTHPISPGTHPILFEGHRDTLTQFTKRFRVTTDNQTAVYAGLGSHNLASNHTVALPSGHSGPAYLSFYARPEVDGVPDTISVQGDDVTLTPTRESDLTVVPVDHGWFYVRKRYTSKPAAIIISGPDDVFIDEVCYYPSAATETEAETTVTLTAYHPIWQKPISITDIRGRTQRFEYNLRGELFRVYDTDGGLLREHFRAEHGEPLAAPAAFDTDGQ